MWRNLKITENEKYTTTTQIYIHVDRSRLREQILLHHPRNNRG